MKKLRASLKWLKAALLWLFNSMGDARSKNVLLFILALLTLFGMIDPERATSLRDTVLGMAL